MIKKNKKILLFGLICFLSLTLFSCGNTAKDLFLYSDKDFSAEIEGSIDGIIIKATVSFVKTQEGESDREMTVRYHSPESLEGLVVSIYSDGTAKTRLGEIEIDGNAFCGLASPFLSICPKGEFSSISYDREGNATVIFSSDEQNLKYSFKKGFSLPEKIEGVASGRRMSVHLFEK